MKEQLIEFVERIQGRNGMASKEEIFLELIDIHSYYFSIWSIGGTSPSYQIEKMWKDIVRKYKSLRYDNKCTVCKLRAAYSSKRIIYDECLPCHKKIQEDLIKSRSFEYKPCKCGNNRYVMPSGKVHSLCLDCKRAYSRDAYVGKETGHYFKTKTGLCNKCEVNDRYVSKKGKVDTYCRECLSEINRISRLKIKNSSGKG